MNPKFAVLGSGSKANSYIFQWNNFGFLIDNGFSSRKVLEKMASGEFSSSFLKFILLTHGHEDHIRGVESLSRKLNIPVIHHRSLDLTRHFSHSPLSKPIEPYKEYQEGALKFLAFPTYHDAPGAVSYYFALGEKRFTLITDTGQTDQDMMNLASRSDVVFLESNYCPEILDKGPYPWALKQRISSNQGHLSNQQALDFINKLPQGTQGPSSIYLVHLSETNNTPEKVQFVLDQGLKRPGQVIVCPKSTLVMGDYGNRP